MAIDTNLIRVTHWDRGQGKMLDGTVSTITLTYRGKSVFPTLSAAFEVPSGCSDAEALKLAHHWFHTLCTSLGTSTSDWVMSEGEEEALWKKQS